MSRAFQQVRAFAETQFVEHKIETVLDRGIFRSFRCQTPGTWSYAFDVTFKPGWVFVTGDIGHLALTRETDMLPWLRGVLSHDSGGIDLRYVHEKVPNNITCREWDKEAAREFVDSVLADVEIDYEERLGLYEFFDQHTFETTIVTKLADIDPCFYECGDPTEWTGRFLWCVLALRWFVRTLDGKPFFVPETESATA